MSPHSVLLLAEPLFVQQGSFKGSISLYVEDMTLTSFIEEFYQILLAQPQL